MVDARTIEDLAMSLVEKQHPDLYRDKIKPLYKIVKDDVRGVLNRLKGGFIDIELGYGTHYSNLGLNSVDEFFLISELEDKFGIDEIGTECAAGFTNIYRIVVYLLGNKDIAEYDELAKELVEKSFKEVKTIYKRIRRRLPSSLKIGINTRFKETTGLKMRKFERWLNQNLIHNEEDTSKLMQKTIYDVVEYVAEKRYQIKALILSISSKSH